MAEHHKLTGCKLHIYGRENSRYWQRSSYLGGQNRRMTTKEEGLTHAKDIAEDWSLGLRGKARNGELFSSPSFKKVADQFLAEYETITQGQRAKRWIEAYGRVGSTPSTSTDSWRQFGCKTREWRDHELLYFDIKNTKVNIITVSRRAAMIARGPLARMVSHLVIVTSRTSIAAIAASSGVTTLCA